MATPVAITFRPVPSADSEAFTWTASMKTDDGCGELSPAADTWQGGDVTVTLKMNTGQRGTPTMFLNATDGKGRRAKTVGIRFKFN